MKKSHRLLGGVELKYLKTLQVGQNVLIPNHTGVEKISKRCYKTGHMVEDMGNDKNMISVDGSGRITDWNPEFLRQCSPATPQPTIQKYRCQTSHFLFQVHWSINMPTNPWISITCSRGQTRCN